jgi:hypothetical protein
MTDRNREAAGIILGDPVKYGGEESALVVWARMIVARHGKRRTRAKVSTADLTMESLFEERIDD